MRKRKPKLANVKQINIRVTPEVMAWLECLASEQDRSASYVAHSLVMRAYRLEQREPHAN